MKQLFLVLLALAGVLPLARAQDQNHAKASMYARADGDDVRIAIEVKIDRTWHLYHGPTAEELGSPGAVGEPTNVAFEGAGFEFSAIRILERPEHEEQDFGDGSPKTIYEHRGTITIHARAKRIDPAAKVEAIKAAISGQTCKDGPGGICTPYGETLRVKGEGKDELFAKFPADLAAGATQEASSIDPLAFPGTTEENATHAQASLFARSSGDEVRLAIRVEIESGWHLYHGPTKAEMGSSGAIGTPTSVAFTGAGFEFSAVRIAEKPKAATQDFGDGEPKTIYEHQGTITIHARAKRIDAQANVEAIRATVTGQTCQDGPAGTCVDYSEELEVAGAGDDAWFAKFPADLAQSATSSGAAKAPVDASDETKVATGSDSGGAKEPGLLRFLFEAVFWGFITLLMPCTYPMIPITISYFTKQAAQRQTSVLPLSLAYGIGIVLVFVVIGLVASTVIVPFASHPITNIVIGAIFIVFSLSLFGLFTLQPPQFLLGVAGKASMKGGYLGVFLMGTTLVVTSFTCTAPFVGALLGSGATSGGFGRIALGMAVFGATMALPFTALSLLPQKAKSLPKSGEWMHTLKVTMGFVELAAALKFVSNADLVWGWGFLSQEMFLLLWMAIFAITALYLLGVIKLADEHEERIGPGRLVGGLVFALLSAYSLYGALGNKLDPLMTAIAPPYSNAQAALVGEATPGKRPRSHTIVKDDFDAAVELAAREKKRLLVNFTGVT